MNRPVRLLPVAVPLVRAEIIGSYLNRLANANHLSNEDLAHYLSAEGRQAARPDVARLAAATGHDPTRLAEMLVGLVPGRFTPQTTIACRCCMAQRGITLAVRQVTPDLLLCGRHCRWLGGPGFHLDEQYDLTSLPDVVAAHQRHQRLLRRHGAPFRDHFNEASYILHRWTERGDWPQRRTERLAHYFDLQRSFITANHPIMAMANYPETVALAALLANEHWTDRAISVDLADRDAFENEVGLRLQIPYQHYTPHDPLNRWCENHERQRRFQKLLNYNETWPRAMSQSK